MNCSLSIGSTTSSFEALTTRNVTDSLGEYEYPPSEILPGLYLGNQENAYNKAHLKALGISHILNVASQADCPHKDVFTYKKISLLDTDDEDILQHMDGALKFIEEGLRSGKVLVHCISGMSRSAAVIMGWLIQNKNMNFENALDFLITQRPIVNPNEGFRDQLARFAQKKMI